MQVFVSFAYGYINRYGLFSVSDYLLASVLTLSSPCRQLKRLFTIKDMVL